MDHKARYPVLILNVNSMAYMLQQDAEDDPGFIESLVVSQAAEEKENERQCEYVRSAGGLLTKD
jgi:hypothetical protein